MERNEEEPIFILRAQDSSAPALIQMWISLNIFTAPAEKIISATKKLEEFNAWPKKKKAD